MEKIADYLVYIKDGEVVLNDFLDHLLTQFKIVKGDSNQIDEELMHLTQYFEINKTGYTALTTQANVFYEIFGNAVAITSPTIEDLMVYLEKGTPKHNLGLSNN
ncbi:multidrug ABC transporter ATPase [Staphylococcus cohnii]|nr:multidrug ABC transporter ATPase [Staphylococcus cohnii]